MTRRQATTGLLASAAPGDCVGQAARPDDQPLRARHARWAGGGKPPDRRASIGVLGVREALLVNGAVALVAQLVIGRWWLAAPLPLDGTIPAPTG